MTQFDFSVQLPGEKQLTVLSAGVHFRFDIDMIEQHFGASLSPLMTDLLRIGIAAYTTDRLVQRRKRDQQRHWSRTLSIRIGVLEPEFWNTSEIKDQLIHSLEFVSDDTWDIDFVEDKRRKPRKFQRSLFPFTSETRICLNSGGLDSAAGLGNRLAEVPSYPTIPVTVWHQGGQRFMVQKQVELLRRHYSNTDLNPLIIKSHLLHGAIPRHSEESSQRSRSFLFMAVGAAAASLCGVTEVEVYESGIGAINLPLMAGMTGSRTTRSTHPAFLRSMSALTSLIQGNKFLFDLPFINRTKGEVVKKLAENGLSQLAANTVSCVHFPLREKIGKQCGVCPACLFRRQAMLTAGIEECSDTYKYDLFTRDRSRSNVPAKHLNTIKAYAMQINMLKGVEDTASEGVLRHLVGTEIAESVEHVSPYTRLLGRYRDQWLEVARRAQVNGHSWTKMLGPLDLSKEEMIRVSA